MGVPLGFRRGVDGISANVVATGAGTRCRGRRRVRARGVLHRGDERRRRRRRRGRPGSLLVTTTAAPTTTEAPTTTAAPTTTEAPTTTVAPPPTEPPATEPPPTEPPPTEPPATTLPPNIVPVSPVDPPLGAVGSRSGGETARVQSRLFELGFWLQGADGELRPHDQTSRDGLPEVHGLRRQRQGRPTHGRRAHFDDAASVSPGRTPARSSRSTRPSSCCSS